MGNFFALISIENIKLWKRISAKVMLIIMVVLIIVATGIYKYYTVVSNISNNTTASASWKKDLQKTVTAEKIQLAQQKKSKALGDELTVGVTQKTIAEGEYRINNNMKPESSFSIWTMVTKLYTAGFGALIILFAVIVCTASVAGEFSEGTMKMMISRPYSRYQILTAKLISIILYNIVLVITAFVLILLSAGIFFGFDGFNGKEMILINDKIVYAPAALKTLLIFGLDFLEAIVYIIVAFVISAVSRSRSIATGFSLFLVLVGAGIIELLAIIFTWGKFLPLAVTNFSTFISSGVPIQGVSLSFSIIVSLLYSVLFCFLGYFVFQKRDI